MCRLRPRQCEVIHSSKTRQADCVRSQLMESVQPEARLRAEGAKCRVMDRKPHSVRRRPARSPAERDKTTHSIWYISSHPCKSKSMSARHFKHDVFLSHNRAQKD